MSTDDPLVPLTRRLRRLAKDAANAVSSVLVLFTGLRETSKPRRELRKQAHELRERFDVFITTFGKLDEILEILEHHAGELSEQELIDVVEQAADSVIVAEQVGGVAALDYVTLATRLLKLPPEKHAEVVREVGSYRNGKTLLLNFKLAIEDYLEDAG